MSKKIILIIFSMFVFTSSSIFADELNSTNIQNESDVLLSQSMKNRNYNRERTSNNSFIDRVKDRFDGNQKNRNSNNRDRYNHKYNRDGYNRDSFDDNRNNYRNR